VITFCECIWEYPLRISARFQAVWNEVPVVFLSVYRLMLGKCPTVVKFDVFTAVTMKNAVSWDVAPCRSCVNRRFRGTYRLHLQDRKIRERGTSVSRWMQTESRHKIYTVPHPRRRHSSVLHFLPYCHAFIISFIFPFH
jgi:hypothetical protein